MKFDLLFWEGRGLNHNMLCVTRRAISGPHLFKSCYFIKIKSDYVEFFDLEEGWLFFKVFPKPFLSIYTDPVNVFAAYFVESIEYFSLQCCIQT